MFLKGQKVHVKESKIGTYPQQFYDVIPSQYGTILHVKEDIDGNVEYGIEVTVLDGNAEDLKEHHTELVYFDEDELEPIPK
jgi:hypothetical protein